MFAHLVGRHGLLHYLYLVFCRFALSVQFCFVVFFNLKKFKFAKSFFQVEMACDVLVEKCDYFLKELDSKKSKK
jgi:hypothetical protein